MPHKALKKLHHYPYTWPIVFLAVVLSLLFITRTLNKNTVPDVACGGAADIPISELPQLSSARDYYMRGDYEYDRGNCELAVIYYTRSIELNPNFPQVYNNRAYTHMRLRNYSNALADLNYALTLRPDYVNALMNRADIRTFYYDKNYDKALADYTKVVDLNGVEDTSVCSHMFVARHGGWGISAFIDLPSFVVKSILKNFTSQKALSCP